MPFRVPPHIVSCQQLPDAFSSGGVPPIPRWRGCLFTLSTPHSFGPRLLAVLLFWALNIFYLMYVCVCFERHLLIAGCVLRPLTFAAAVVREFLPF